MTQWNLTVICCLVPAALVVPSALAADQEVPATFVYATYSKCDLTRQERADEILKGVYAPVYDEAVSSRKIQAWGWLAHNTGGEWRRANYFVATGIDATLAAGEAMSQRIRKENAIAGQEFRGICYEHEDYIWRLVSGSKPAAEVAKKRSPVGISTYFVCDPSKEARADAIVKDVLAPLWNAQVKAGNIASWIWLQHYLGGEYRRLAAIDGPSFESLFAAQDAVIKTLTEKQPDTMKEFNEICGSHQDYMWDIQIARP